MRRILGFLGKELLEMLPPTLFFLVVFHLVLLVRRLVGEDGDFELTTSAAAVVAALTVGKAVLIADALPLFRLFRQRPLVLDVLWRSLLYLGIALVLQLLEEAVPPVLRHGGAGEALARLGEEIHWRRFWATHAALGVFLLFYTFATALIRVIGAERFRRIFFGWGSERDGDAAAGA